MLSPFYLFMPVTRHGIFPALEDHVLPFSTDLCCRCRSVPTYLPTSHSPVPFHAIFCIAVFSSFPPSFPFFLHVKGGEMHLCISMQLAAWVIWVVLSFTKPPPPSRVASSKLKEDNTRGHLNINNSISLP